MYNELAYSTSNSLLSLSFMSLFICYILSNRVIIVATVITNHVKYSFESKIACRKVIVY